MLFDFAFKTQGAPKANALHVRFLTDIIPCRPVM